MKGSVWLSADRATFVKIKLRLDYYYARYVVLCPLKFLSRHRRDRIQAIKFGELAVGSELMKR